jgi:hypothetical protein
MTTIGISLKKLSSPLSSPSPSSSPEHNNDSYGLSHSLFSKEQQHFDDENDDDDQINETITSLSHQLSTLDMKESPADAIQIRESLNNLIDKIRKLGIQ